MDCELSISGKLWQSLAEDFVVLKYLDYGDAENRMMLQKTTTKNKGKHQQCDPKHWTAEGKTNQKFVLRMTIPLYVYFGYSIAELFRGGICIVERRFLVQKSQI
jgi:hypothetical protein